MITRTRLAIAGTLAVVALAAPATASADPFQLTDWSPARSPDYFAGTYHATAVNPDNGRVLVFGYQYDDPASSYFSSVTEADGTPVGAVNTFAEQNAYSSQSFGAAYNPVTGGWVVSYIHGDDYTVNAQFLNADGTADGAPIVISSTLVNGCCSGSAVAYQSKGERFLFAWSDYDPTASPKGRFVSASGGIQGTGEFELMSAPGDLDWDDYHQLSIAYSPEQDNFGLIVRSDTIPDSEYRPWLQLLGSNGLPIGSQRALSSNSNGGVGNPDIAYNAARDEYGVVWTDYDETGLPRVIQRINASDGSSVGSPVSQQGFPAAPGGEPSGNRNKIVAHPTADQYYVTTWGVWSDGSSSTRAILGWKSAGDGTQDTASLQWLMAPPTYTESVRPQITFNPSNCSYLVTATGSDDANTSWNLYGNYIEAQSPCKPQPPSGKPYLKSVSTGRKSLKVRVGCSGDEACRVKLTGVRKLKKKTGRADGKAKGKTVDLDTLVTRTVALSAGQRKTVKLAYTEYLQQTIRRALGRSNPIRPKIQVSAKQVGGGRKTIVVFVK